MRGAGVTKYCRPCASVSHLPSGGSRYRGWAGWAVLFSTAAATAGGREVFLSAGFVAGFWGAAKASRTSAPAAAINRAAARERARNGKRGDEFELSIRTPWPE